MKNSKKGFTLTEILIVTAIIVIISGAAIAGIAVTIQNAQERGQNFQAQQGENWESGAVLKVKNTKIELGNEQTYEESADTPAPTAGASSNEEELSSTPTDAPTTTPDGGNTNTNGNTNGNTNTNTNGNTNTNTNTSGNTNAGGGTNAAGSSVKLVQNDNNGWNSSLSFDSAVTKVIINTDSNNFSVNDNGKYSTTKIGDGQYEVTWQAEGWGVPKSTKIPFNVDNGTTYVTIVSYE